MRGFAESLRSQAHESANRLHTSSPWSNSAATTRPSRSPPRSSRLSQQLIDRLTTAVARAGPGGTAAGQGGRGRRAGSRPDRHRGHRARPPPVPSAPANWSRWWAISSTTPSTRRARAPGRAAVGGGHGALTRIRAGGPGRRQRTGHVTRGTRARPPRAATRPSPISAGSAWRWCARWSTRHGGTITAEHRPTVRWSSSAIPPRRTPNDPRTDRRGRATHRGGAPRRTSDRVPGFSVHSVVHTGSAAMRAVAAANATDDPIDLVLLDIGLPDASGLDVAAALGGRATDAPTSSRSPRPATCRWSARPWRTGVVLYLLKPFTFAAFRDKLERYLEFRRALPTGEKAVSQRDIDRAMAALRSSDERAAAPKGVAPQTLDTRSSSAVTRLGDRLTAVAGGGRPRGLPGHRLAVSRTAGRRRTGGPAHRVRARGPAAGALRLALTRSGVLTGAGSPQPRHCGEAAYGLIRNMVRRTNGLASGIRCRRHPRVAAMSRRCRRRRGVGSPAVADWPPCPPSRWRRPCR